MWLISKCQYGQVNYNKSTDPFNNPVALMVHVTRFALYIPTHNAQIQCLLWQTLPIAIVNLADVTTLAPSKLIKNTIRLQNNYIDSTQVFFVRCDLCLKYT
jgi:hypothetical protein